MYAAKEEGYSTGDYRGYAIISSVSAVAGATFLAAFVVEALNGNRETSEAQFCKGTFSSEKAARMAAYAEAERYIDSILA